MYVFGKNVVQSLIDNGSKINKALVYKDFREKELLSKLNCPIRYYDLKELDRFVDGNHQGIIVDIDEYEDYDIDDIIKENGFIVMLDHLEDPHNFGAIIRTCEALGVDAIIIPSDRSVTVNSTVVKTSAGAIYNQPIVKVSNLAATIQKLKDIGYWIVGTDMNGEDYTKIDYNMPICLVIGNEGHGMSRIIKENCDYIAKIPMIGKINSLNASVSCGIVLARIVASR